MKSLRHVLLFRFGLVLGVVLVASAFVTVFPIHSQLVREKQEDLLREARILAKTLPVEALSGEGALLDVWVKSLVAPGQERITITGADGEVLADSQAEPGSMDNHADRNEIKMALDGKEATSVRRSPTMGEDFVYAAVPFYEGEELRGVVRVSVSEDSLTGTVLSTWLVILAAWAVLLALLFAVVAWTQRTLERDLREMGAAADQLVLEGKLDAMPRPALSDLQGLARDLEAIGSRAKEQYQSLRGERDKLEAILENISAGILVLDVAGKVEMMNPAAERVLGTERAQADGRSLAEIHPSTSIDRAVMEALDGYEAEAEAQISQPRRLTLRIRTSPIRGEDYGVEGVICILEDLTGARSLERVRRDFVANVSHELRTPVANLQALVEALQAGALEEGDTARRFLGDLDAETARLARLIEDLLTLSRLESAEFTPHMQPVDMAELAAQVIEDKKLLAERFGVTVAARSEASRTMVGGDAALIKTACANLLDNAIKYNRPGGEVDVVLEADADEVRISFKDTGIGIPRGDRKRVFERFYRVDRARSRDTGGTGLGLSIVKHVADLHGGWVDLDSEEGKGSTFTIKLPRRP